ncbi:hypothetical protein [Kitasatospora sp. NPDC050463]|uniref:hypothetical protein n=1 Tax=Kitasatospora sp. NPDC050463 TaxID=3155786 RepID=UPI0033D80DB2
MLFGQQDPAGRSRTSRSVRPVVASSQSTRAPWSAAPFWPPRLQDSEHARR